MAAPHVVDALAQAAVQGVRSGMIVGLGTGRTATRCVRELAARVRAERLDIDCVCTSSATEELAGELALPVIPFSEVEEIDYLFDGANEVDHQLRMLKGQHGAITRQRLVAQVAGKRVYVVGEDRYVGRLGETAPLTMTIVPFGIASIRARLRDMGLGGVVRRTFEGELLITDGGGVVIDVQLPECDPAELARELDGVAGVVDHGLFLDEADEVLVEGKGGEVRRLVRPARL